jgi:Amt family ammonium transporter
MRCAAIRSHIVEIVANTAQSGDVGYMIICTALVFLMIPGVGYVYAIIHGAQYADDRADSSTLVWPDASQPSRVSFQWFFWCYSLAFSHRAGKFIGALDNFGFKNVLAQPSVGSPRIPDLLYAVYQGMFAAIT